MGKTHDFTKIVWGQEFIFEAPLESIQGAVTGQGALEAGDHIVLCLKCRVEEVEYYINAPEIWQARVTLQKPVSLENIAENNPLQTIRNVIAHLGDSLNQGDLYQRLEQIFTTDRITQVANRGRLESRLSEQWKQMRRSQAPLSLILCAIDGLSAYQEVYGLAATDRCLHDIAQVIRLCAKRPSDLVARYTEHMFAVLLPETPEAGLQSVLTEVRSQLCNLPCLAPDSKPSITLRLGSASMVPSVEQEVHSLIQAAARSLT